jgi:hypothetical protein
MGIFFNPIVVLSFLLEMLDKSSFRYALQYVVENDSCGTFLRVLAVTTAVNCDPQNSPVTAIVVLGNILNIPHPQMGQKARGLAQLGGPPGWLEESNPAGLILCVMEGPYPVPVALTGTAQLRAVGISSCCYIVNVQNHPL